MGHISKEDYNLLPLKSKLGYYSVTTRKCCTEGCTEENIEVTDNSEEPPFDFIHAMEMTENGPMSKNLPIKHVCTTCMVKMKVVEVEYFKKVEAKFRFNAPKAAVDRGKNYYKDFSKNYKADPNAGQETKKLSKEDIQNFEKRLNKK
jgi:hypothetical protein